VYGQSPSILKIIVQRYLILKSNAYVEHRVSYIRLEKGRILLRLNYIGRFYDPIVWIF